MTYLVYDSEPASIAAFIIFTLIMGFLGGWATGRSIASTWRSPLVLIPAVLLLPAPVRFLHYAIAAEELTSVYYYLEAVVVVSLAASYGFMSYRAEQMAGQYSWLYGRSGALGWSPKVRP